MSSTLSPGHDPPERGLTHRDLDYTPDDGNRWELIDGSLFVTPFPTYAHQLASTELTFLLLAHVRANQLGKVFAAGLKVVLDEPTGVGPDVVYISAGRMDGMREDGFHGAPDLLVEILSSKPELDRVVKFHKYAAAGVPHYWIVDPERRSIREYRLEGDGYRLVAEHVGDTDFEPVLFPGLTVPLAELWIR
ncbi:MAG: Uma2 family endonuclease [bacterium]